MLGYTLRPSLLLVHCYFKPHNWQALFIALYVLDEHFVYFLELFQSRCNVNHLLLLQGNKLSCVTYRLLWRLFSKVRDFFFMDIIGLGGYRSLDVFRTITSSFFLPLWF